MKTLKHDITLRLVKLLDVFFVTLPFIGCWYFYYAEQIAFPFFRKGNYVIILLYHKIQEIVYSQFLAFSMSDLIIYIVICLLCRRIPNILPGVACLFAQLLITTVWSYLIHHAYFSTYQAKPTAIIYDQRVGMEKLIVSSDLVRKFDVQINLQVDDCLNNLDALKNVEVVFLSGIHSHDRNIILKYCIANNIKVFVIPRVGDVIMSGAKSMHMFHLLMLSVNRYMASVEYLFIKRVLDILISLILLIALSPILIITAIAVKSDGGPAFYKQVRLTKDGKQFEIIKFRSMKVNAEADGVARLSSEHDDRITKVGHIIRACRIDELPQLLNILKGDLSIVGPRPERPEIAEEYCKEMPEFALRLQCKAGLTGYAQVYGKYNTTPYDKLQMDLLYIAHPSIAQDVMIFLETVKILFMPESTEGISEGQTTAMSGDKQ